MDLSIVRDREKLRPNKKAEPCWQRIRPGCYVGYTPSAKGGQGTWIARAYDEETRRYRRKALGAFPELAGDKKFTAAKAEAERFAHQVSSGGHVAEKIEIVADACRAFAKGRPEDEARFRRYVYDDPIAKLKLDKLRRRHVMEWRERLEALPALVSRRKKGEPVYRKRTAATVNRDMAVLRAALGKVLSPGAPNSEAAWQEALKSAPNANGRRTLYLDRSQRRKLLEKTDTEAAPFVRALCLLPLRPGHPVLQVGDLVGEITNPFRTPDFQPDQRRNGERHNNKNPKFRGAHERCFLIIRRLVSTSATVTKLFPFPAIPWPRRWRDWEQ